MENKEIEQVEKNQWWSAEKAKYIPAAPKFSEEKKDTEALDMQIEKAYDKVDDEEKWAQHEIQTEKTTWWRDKSSEEWGKQNPEKINRISAGKDVVNDLSQPQKKWNILGRTFQWISTKILWENNM